MSKKYLPTYHRRLIERRSGNEAFFTKAGWLTHYAFACGYLEMFEIQEKDKHVKVWIEMEHRQLAVRAHDYLTDEVKPLFGVRGRLEWQGAENLAEARNLYKKFVNQYIYNKK